jgi:hypothetical protein
MDNRRVRGLIRDEGRLRSALAEHEKRRFDVDTAQTVTYRVEDLLETIGLIVQDADFWTRLSDINRPPTSQQLERLRHLDTLAFAALLEAAGYASPPPPPADELVDDTVQALIVALSSSANSHIEQTNQADFARWQLQTLVMRVRRQISSQQTPELAPSILRSSARSLGRAARWLIPRVVAATAGAMVESHAPGSGLGLLASRSVERTAEDLGELAADMVVGVPLPALAIASRGEPGWTEIDPLSLHLAALSDQLNSLILPADHDVPVAYVRDIISSARRHLNRIEELIADNNRETMDLTEHIRRLGDAIDVLSRPIFVMDDPPISVAEIAIGIVGGIRTLLKR